MAVCPARGQQLGRTQDILPRTAIRLKRKIFKDLFQAGPDHLFLEIPAVPAFQTL